MERTSALVMAVVLVVEVLAWVPVAGLADSTAQLQQTNETQNGSVAPGEVLAGVVGVEQAEFDGELDARTFALRLSNATTNESKAAILAAEFGSLENRSEELAERRAELTAARENGSISEGKYRAELAKLHAQSKTVQRLVNQTANASEGLPAETLEAKGINATAVRMLQSEAETLTGPETAAVAQTIAGPDAGESAASDDAPDVAQNRSQGGADRAEDATDGDRGPPENRTEADNRTERPGASNGNATDSTPGDDARNGTDDRPNGTDAGNETQPDDAGDGTGPGDAGNGTQSGDAGNETRSDDATDSSQSDGTDSGTQSGDDQTPADGSDDSGGAGGSDGGSDSGNGDSRAARIAAPLR